MKLLGVMESLIIILPRGAAQSFASECKILNIFTTVVANQASRNSL